MHTGRGVGIALLLGLFAASAHAEEADLLVCPLMHAKKMPERFRVEAMRFTGPAGEGRRGSAGFVVATQSLLKGKGTRWRFTFRRHASGFGFQVIHPFGKGHVVISLLQGVTIHPGGSWGAFGWGKPNNSLKVQLLTKAHPLVKQGGNHQIVSELSPEGRYRLWIDGRAICDQKIASAKPLVLEIPAKGGFYCGSSWDRTSFAGRGFKGRLRPGDGGVILGPMDGSGPRHNVAEIRLSAVSPAIPPVPKLPRPFRDPPKSGKGK